MGVSRRDERMRRNGRYAPIQKKLKMEPLVFIGK